jgi:tetratricopeptide (TPR) repeat protein
MPTDTQTNSKKNLIIGVIIVALLAGAAWWYMNRAAYILPLESGDSVASWEFEGFRNDDGELEAEARAEIERFEGLMGGDQSGENDDPTDYTLYVAIAQQYEQLGDGAAARANLEKALAIDSETTGLAWHNLGSLMSRVGANNTARAAYRKATEAQPNVSNYHLAYLNFLTNYFSSDISLIDGAFASAYAALGDDLSILQADAAWYEKSDRPEKALETMKKMQSALPVEARATVNAEISRLENN